MPSLRPRVAAAAASLALAASLLGLAPANAAIVPTVQLGTAAEYSVIGGSTVTNTGPSVLNLSLAVHPGLAVTGFPLGLVVAPGTTHLGDANALQAQSDLTTAYNDAALRSVDQTGPADLVGLNLQAGTYETSGKGPLLLSGNVTLDGAGDPTSVFIFQTDSTLTTASSSTVTLINGAQACNVFWQVGSSATLGTDSSFVGNILALTSISVSTNVTVEGRALARNGAVTLDNDTFVAPACAVTPVSLTTTTVATTATTTVAQTGDDGTEARGTGGDGTGNRNTIDRETGGGDVPPTLAFTGGSSDTSLILAMTIATVGAIFLALARHRPSFAKSQGR